MTKVKLDSLQVNDNKLSHKKRKIQHFCDYDSKKNNSEVYSSGQKDNLGTVYKYNRAMSKR